MIALALVVAAGIGVTRLSRPRLRRPASLDALLLGLLLGPGLRVLDGPTLHALAPLTAFGIGSIGAAFGARLDWRLLRRIPPRAWGLGAAVAGTVFAVTALAAWALIRTVPPLAAAWSPGSPAVVTLAAVATISAGWAGPKLVRRTALFDTAFAALVIALVLPLLQPHGALRGVALTVLASGGLAALFVWLAHWHPDPAHLGIELFGVILAAAGFGYATGLSPFVVCALTTALIVSFSPQPGRVRALLAEWGPSIYTAFLIVVGARLQLPTVWLLPAALLLASVRIGARWASVRFGRTWPAVRALPPHFGLTTVTPGAAGVALAAGFDLVYGGSGGGAVLTTVLVGVLLAEAMAGPLRQLAAREATPLTAAPPRAEVT
jgi:hypothetical protein